MSDEKTEAQMDEEVVEKVDTPKESIAKAYEQDGRVTLYE